MPKPATVPLLDLATLEQAAECLKTIAHPHRLPAVRVNLNDLIAKREHNLRRTAYQTDVTPACIGWKARTGCRRQ